MRRSALNATLVALSACSSATEGPVPAVERVINPRTPEAQVTRLCNAQGASANGVVRGWRLTLKGKRFSPMPGGVLTGEPFAQLPQVTLRGPSTYTLPRERVVFVDAETLEVDVPTSDTEPAVELAPGSYAVEVTNPLGGTSALEDAVLVGPPATLTRVVPPPGGFRYGEAATLVVEGAGFQPGTPPSLFLTVPVGPGETPDDERLTPVAAESPTVIEAQTRPFILEARYDLVLGLPEGCQTRLAGAVDVTYPHLGALTMSPRSGDAEADVTVHIQTVPTGSEHGFTGVPGVFVWAPLKLAPTNHVRIPLRDVVRESPTDLRAVLPTCSGARAPVDDPGCPHGLAPGGPYIVEVIDPSNGAFGELRDARGFTVTQRGALDAAPEAEAPAP
ncbi:hypothetical protein LZ198_37920 [Myxococcus sp. K15C18031901]|uniref:hypothetical protein n=1 Tax=Myxococcus dinghuensis TaxID=2906761 RepID=UPI0020A7EE16|nr:hypothetical protein [Myxococcus dinghuensis]MCP3104658.1 hypothetical protein [Myxococcus dinghuensis]